MQLSLANSVRMLATLACASKLVSERDLPASPVACVKLLYPVCVVVRVSVSVTTFADIIAAWWIIQVSRLANVDGQ